MALTTLKVANALRKAGFTKSDSSTTAVKGWHSVTHGFTVHRSHESDYDVLVGLRAPVLSKVDSRQIPLMQEALVKAGFVATITEDGKDIKVRSKDSVPVLEPEGLTDAIMEEFLQLAYDLSPENLTCDGELPSREVNRRYKELMTKWYALEARVGHKVDQGEVWSWHMKKQGH